MALAEAAQEAIWWHLLRQLRKLCGGTCWGRSGSYGVALAEAAQETMRWHLLRQLRKLYGGTC